MQRTNPAATNKSNESFKILAIDDHNFFRKLIAGIILKLGYQVFLADNINKAMIMVQKVKPDLILLDYHLGQCSADEMLYLLSKETNLPDIPIVIVSGAIKEHHDVDKTILVNGSRLEFISKPIHPMELDLIINNYIKMSSVA